MDGLLVVGAGEGPSQAPFLDPSRSFESDLIQKILVEPERNHDSVSLDFQELYKSLSVTARKVIDKLNELLKNDLPNGIQSLNPADVTAEATADRIVRGATAFFDAFAKQNPNLAGEELLNKFMDTIRGGIQSGYDDAYSTLEGLGAFEFEGVREGVEQTRTLIDGKLASFEKAKRKELGLDSDDAQATVSGETKNSLIAQAGGGALSIIA